MYPAEQTARRLRTKEVQEQLQKLRSLIERCLATTRPGAAESPDRNIRRNRDGPGDRRYSRRARKAIMVAINCNRSLCCGIHIVKSFVA